MQAGSAWSTLLQEALRISDIAKPATHLGPCLPLGYKLYIPVLSCIPVFQLQFGYTAISTAHTFVWVTAAAVVT